MSRVLFLLGLIALLTRLYYVGNWNQQGDLGKKIMVKSDI